MQPKSKGCSEVLSSYDMFGHGINLTFERHSNSYKTCFGGMASVMIKIFLLFYLYLNVFRVVTYQNNLYQLNETKYELSDELVSFKNLNLSIFHHLTHLGGFKPDVSADNELSRYVKIEYLQVLQTAK